MVKRWVRYVMPVMGEVDGEDDEVLRVVTLPEEVRRDRDDRGHSFIESDDRYSEIHPYPRAVRGVHPNARRDGVGH